MLECGMRNTPFDQRFYLILNVAVGGTNGFWKDGVGTKPWGDGSLTGPKEFWDARQLWQPTWGKPNDRGMTVKSVKMYNEGSCQVFWETSALSSMRLIALNVWHNSLQKRT
jgi:hypothetical protein